VLESNPYQKFVGEQGWANFVIINPRFDKHPEAIIYNGVEVYRNPKDFGFNYVRDKIQDTDKFTKRYSKKYEFIELHVMTTSAEIHEYKRVHQSGKQKIVYRNKRISKPVYDAQGRTIVYRCVLLEKATGAWSYSRWIPLKKAETAEDAAMFGPNDVVKKLATDPREIGALVASMPWANEKTQ